MPTAAQMQVNEPAWFHHQGSLLEIYSLSEDKRELVLGDGRSLISEMIIVANKLDPSFWVTTKLTHARGGNDIYEKRIPRREFALMFGVEEDAPERYERPNIGIRVGSYLNLPGAGTSDEGDPNFSIELKGPIFGAIRDVYYAAA